MHLSSASKVVGFDHHNFLSGTLCIISNLMQLVYQIFYLESCKLPDVSIKHIKYALPQVVSMYSWVLNC